MAVAHFVSPAPAGVRRGFTERIPHTYSLPQPATRIARLLQASAGFTGRAAIRQVRVGRCPGGIGNLGMEEQFILRVPPSVAERIEHLMNESAAASSSSNPEDASLDLSFSDDGRSGTFMIGNESFPASLLDLPTVVESYKTYDDSVLIKTADIGQMIMVRGEDDPAPEGVEYKHGLTPPMRDARRRRFRREPDLNVFDAFPRNLFIELRRISLILCMEYLSTRMLGQF